MPARPLSGPAHGWQVCARLIPGSVCVWRQMHKRVPLASKAAAFTHAGLTCVGSRKKRKEGGQAPRAERLDRRRLTASRKRPRLLCFSTSHQLLARLTPIHQPSLLSMAIENLDVSKTESPGLALILMPSNHFICHSPLGLLRVSTSSSRLSSLFYLHHCPHRAIAHRSRWDMSPSLVPVSRASRQPRT